MKHVDYITRGTCSQMISFDLDGDRVHNVSFFGGCDGNLKAIPKLLEGMTVKDIEEKLKGITCGRRDTSCADQLVQAILSATAEA